MSRKPMSPHNRQQVPFIPKKSGGSTAIPQWIGSLNTAIGKEQSFTTLSTPITIHRQKYLPLSTKSMSSTVLDEDGETSGYNLIVDRYGGIWEGRDEGVPRQVKPASQVIGAQAKSFNSATFGVAVLGNFANDNPTDQAVRSVAAAIAWEFNALGISDPNGTFEYYGTQQRINGHGDSSLGRFSQ